MTNSVRYWRYSSGNSYLGGNQQFSAWTQGLLNGRELLPGPGNLVNYPGPVLILENHHFTRPA